MLPGQLTFPGIPDPPRPLGLDVRDLNDDQATLLAKRIAAELPKRQPSTPEEVRARINARRKGKRQC